MEGEVTSVQEPEWRVPATQEKSESDGTVGGAWWAQGRKEAWRARRVG